jgi:DNA-directed RNA polymerase specialized sigma subunit
MSTELTPRPKKKDRKSLNPRRTTEADRTIISQMWKATQVARKISSFTGLNYEDLRDVALEYIVRLHKTWDPSKGANFSTWVNRNLQFHMLNYLRDHSRLVRIPRSYSDLYLKIRKYLVDNPNISDEEVAEKAGVPTKKVAQVRKAFSMTFTELNDQSEVVEDVNVEDEGSLEGLFSSNKEILFKIAELDEKDEEFLTDVLVRKRTLATIFRKNPELKNQVDVNKKTNDLIGGILCLDPKKL